MQEKLEKNIYNNLNLLLTQTKLISGVTILAILEDTVTRENTKELIYWNNENICKDSNMDHTDNIANVFLPQIMKVKESMIALKAEVTDLEPFISYIKVNFFFADFALIFLDEVSLKISYFLLVTKSAFQSFRNACFL